MTSGSGEELDVRCVKGKKLLLVVGIERADELAGDFFGLSHCVSS